MIIIQKLVFLLVFMTINVCTHKSINIDFQIDNATLSQSIYLFDLSNETNAIDATLNKSYSNFNLKKEQNLIYLEYYNKYDLKCNGENHRLSLIISYASYSNEIIDLNVTVYDYKNKKLEDCAKLIENRLNIEYIFKLTNESEYGFIKDDMNPNGIIAIIRIDSTLVNLTSKNELFIKSIQYDENNLDLQNKYFMLKKFMPNFYMLCLTDNTRYLFELITDNKIKIELNLVSASTRNTIACKYVKFKLTSARSLDIQLIHKSNTFNSEAKIDLEILEQYGNECNLVSKYGGVHLFNPQINLESSLFQNEFSNQLYQEKNIRFSLTYSNIDIIELDSLNGNLNVISNKCLDREELNHLNSTLKINVTVYDQRKLFKSIMISLSIRVIDLNDNAPKFKQSEYNLRLNEMTQQSKEIVLFNEQAEDLDENSTLFYELIEATSYFNSKRISLLNMFQIKNNNVVVTSKIFQREEKYFFLRLLCRDNGQPESQFTIIRINLFVESNKPTKIISAEFNFNPDNLKQDFFKIGSLQLSFLHETLKFNSTNKQFNLELLSNNNLMLKKENLFELDKFSFIKFENQEYNLLIYVKFTSVDKYQFGQNLYEFVYAEDDTITNLSNRIGSLETDCTTITSVKLVSDYASLFDYEIKNNQIVLVSTGDLDYELESNLDLKVYAVCSQMYLMSTRVRVKLIDINDNQPQFENPIILNQTFFKQITSFVNNSSFINITRIQAKDNDRTEEFSLLKFKIDFLNEFVINETTGDLFYKLSNKSNQFLTFNLRVTAYNDYQSETLTKYNSKTISIRVIIFIQTQHLISVEHKQIKSQMNNLIEFNLIQTEFYQMITTKCWLTFDFKTLTEIESFYLSVHNSRLYFSKRNTYLSSLDKQIVIECQLAQLNNNYNVLGWTQFSVYFTKEITFRDHLRLNELHYDVSRYELIESKTLLKLDQLFDLNIPLNYLLVYNLNVDNTDLVKSSLSVNRFSGELIKKTNDIKWNQIVFNSDLIRLNIDLSLLFNRHEESSLIHVYLHLSNVSHQSAVFEIKKQLDQIETKLANDLIKIQIKNLQKIYSIQINRANEVSVESKLNFTIEKVIKLDLINNNDIELNEMRLFTINENLLNGFYETNLSLNLAYLEINDQFEKYFQIKLKVCPSISDESELSLNFDSNLQCKQINLNLAIEINLNLNEITFEKKFYKFQFEWTNVSVNRALLSLKSLLTNSSYFNIQSNLIKFVTDSNLVNVNEQTGLIYLSKSYFVKQIQLNASLIEITSERIVCTTHLSIEFYHKQQLVNLSVELDNESLLNEKLVLFSFNQTNSQLDYICLNLNQLVCKSLFEINNLILILNQFEAKKHINSLKNCKILIKSAKNDLILINLTIKMNLKEIQTPTFEYSTELVHLVESKTKKFNILIDTQKEKQTRLDMIRVKNLITNNEVLALDCQFKSINKSQFHLKLDDVMSLEMSQIYSFDFNISRDESNYLSSVYVIRMNKFDLESINTQKQFVSFTCDESFQKQLVLNFSRLDESEENPTSLITQKVYLIYKYSNLNVKYFKIYGSGLYLVNSKYNCDKLITSTSSISILKFYIDKISLRIKKAIEIQLHMEILTQRTRLETYHHKVKLFKTDLITNHYKLDDVLVYKFNLTNDYEFSIDYSNTNLPFEIDQLTGKLNYLPSEDSFEFDSNGEKYFNFDIMIASASNLIDLFKFEFVLVDNDPIVLINQNSLNVKFYIETNSILKRVIGHIDLVELVETNYLKEYFKSNKQEVNFYIQDKDTFFHVDKHNGLLYLKNSIDAFQFDYFNLNLKVNGTIGYKTALISINVLVVVNQLKNFELDSQFNHDIDFYLNSTNQQVDTFQLTNLIQNNDPNVELRFKSLTDLCETSWVSGEIYCNTNKQKATLNILVVYKLKQNLNHILVEHIKVNLINFESYINKMKNLFYSIETKSQLNLSLTLRQETNVKLEDNVNQRLIELGFKIDLNNHRFVFVRQNQTRTNRIANYFNLDQFSSQMVQFRFIDAFVLEDSIHIIELLEENNFRIFKIINLKLLIESNQQIPFAFQNTIVTNIDLNVNNTSDMIKINNVYDIFSHQENMIYFLSEQKLNNLNEEYFVSDLINLENQLKVVLNKSTGDLLVDKTNIYKSCNFSFYLVVKYSNSVNKFEQILYEINFRYNFNSNLVTKLLNDVYESSLEFQILVDESTSLDLNSLLFNQDDLIKKFDLNLTSTQIHQKIPFEIDKFNKTLIYDKKYERTHQVGSYDLIITLNNYFDFMIKCILKDHNYNSLIFDNHLYNVDISLLDFNNLNRVVLQRVKAFYINDDEKSNALLYQFVETDLTSTTTIYKRNLRKLIKLDPYKGEIELVKKSWNIYLDYCNLINQFETNHMSLLYTISVFDKEVSLNSEAKSVVKLNIKCDYLKETFQFEKSFYFVTLNANAKLNSFVLKVNTKKTHLTNSIKINYYFCNLKMNSALLNPFSLNQKTGEIYLNNRLNNKQNYSFEICANLENNFMNKIIRVNLEIQIQNKIEFEFDLFNQNDMLHEIEIPITEKKTYKLFQLKVFNSNKLMKYEYESQDYDMFYLNSTNGWLSLNLDNRSWFKTGKFNFKAAIISGQFRHEIMFKLNLLHFNNTNDFLIELNYPYQREFDFKTLFKTNYKYLILETNQYMTYNSTSGVLTVNNYVSNKIFKCDLKLISSQSDIKLASVQINPFNQIKYKKVVSQNDLFISRFSQINTILYNLNDISDGIQELTNESELFSISSNGQTVYLSASLLSQRSDKISLNLITKFQFINLNVYIIENLYENLQFNRFNYYFKYSFASVDSHIGSVDYNLNKSIFLKLLIQFKLNTFQLSETTCLNTNKFVSNEVFYLKNNIDIYLNMSKHELNCTLYRFVLNIETNTKNISTHVFVELDNLNQIKLSQNRVKHSMSNILLNKSNEINLYELFQNKTSAKAIYSLSLLNENSDEQLEYNFNRLNGMLTLYYDEKQINNKIFSFKINILIQEEKNFYFAQQFSLNVIFPTNKILFKQNMIECELNYLQQNRLFNDRLPMLDLNNFLLSNHSLNLSISNSDLFELDNLIVYFNSNSMQTNKRYFFNFSTLFEINACRASSCQKLLVHFKLNVIPSESNLISEYYSLVNTNLLVKSNSYFKNVNLVKLKRFNQNYFNINNNLTNIINIDNRTNVMSIKSSDLKEIFSLDREQFKVEVNYDSNKRITFETNYVEYSNRYLSSDLQIDVFYFDNDDNLETIYLTELIQSPNKNRYGCELWENDSNEEILFLHSTCKLAIRFNSSDYSDRKQLNLQIRSFDRDSISKSIFYLVKINLIKLDLSKQKYLLITSNNKQKLINLNKNLKSKLNSFIVNEIQSRESQSVLIRTLNDEFFNVNKLSKFFDSIYGVSNYEITFPSKESKCKLKFETTTQNFYYDLSEFKIDYKNLIQTSQYVLLAPDLIKEIDAKNPQLTRNEIKFPSLKNLLFDASTLAISNQIWIRFSFKTESINSFLLSLTTLSTVFSLRINESKLQMNFFQKVINFDKIIEINEWYQFEIVIQSQNLNMKIKKYISNGDYCNEDASFESKSLEFIRFENINFEKLSIGGVDSKFSLAQFRINEYDILEQNYAKNDKYSHCLTNDSSEIFSSNCQLALGSFKSYLNGRIGKLIFKKHKNLKRDSFELSIQFKLNLTNDSFREIILLQSLNSILKLNLHNETRLEYYEYNNLIGWIQIQTVVNSTHKFEIEKKTNESFKFVLNGVEKIFSSQFLFKNDLSTSDFIEISNIMNHSSSKSYILFEDIQINKEKVSLYDGFSPTYETKLILIDSTDQNICYISIENNTIGIKETQNTNNEESLMNSIIAATSLMSLAAFIGIFLLIFSYSNGKFQTNNINIDKIISDKASKFNSRNKLELSINSEQNSLDHSPNSSFSRETPSALINQNLDTASPNSNNNKQYSSEKEKVFQNLNFDFNLLNWQPSFDEFKFVIDEFKEFPCASNLDENAIYHEAENQIDIYLRQDHFELDNDFINKQTFV